MKGIGGNITAKIQTATTTTNDIGEQVNTWADAQTLKGWLDLSSGDSKYQSFNAKIQESTHVFICDYAALNNLTYYALTTDQDIVAEKTYYTRSDTSPDYIYTAVENPVVASIATYYEKHQIITSAETSRMVINNKVYDILLIDNPMEMNQQLEIFLKFTGGQ